MDLSSQTHSSGEVFFSLKLNVNVAEVELEETAHELFCSYLFSNSLSELHHNHLFYPLLLLNIPYCPPSKLPLMISSKVIVLVWSKDACFFITSTTTHPFQFYLVAYLADHFNRPGSIIRYSKSYCYGSLPKLKTPTPTPRASIFLFLSICYSRSS